MAMHPSGVLRLPPPPLLLKSLILPPSHLPLSSKQVFSALRELFRSVCVCLFLSVKVPGGLNSLRLIPLLHLAAPINRSTSQRAVLLPSASSCLTDHNICIFDTLGQKRLSLVGFLNSSAYLLCTLSNDFCHLFLPLRFLPPSTLIAIIIQQDVEPRCSTFFHSSHLSKRQDRSSRRNLGWLPEPTATLRCPRCETWLVERHIPLPRLPRFEARIKILVLLHRRWLPRFPRPSQGIHHRADHRPEAERP